jgi:monoamine oxidase
VLQGETWKLKGGNSQLINHLFKQIGGEACVTLNAPVRSVSIIPASSSCAEELVCVEISAAAAAGAGTPSRFVTARQVIFAIPPTQLQRIHFDETTVGLPPAWRLQVGGFQMGQCIKTFTYFKTPFWRRHNLNGRVLCTGGVGWASKEVPMPAADVYDVSAEPGRYCLLGFVDAADAERWAGRSEAERRAALVKQYEVLLNGGEAVEGGASEYAEKVWSAEPYVGGAFFASCTRAGMLATYGRDWCKPLRGGRILFAGTEAANSWSGYMEGAMEAGERAVRVALAAREIFSSAAATASTASIDAVLEAANKTVDVPVPAGRPGTPGSMVDPSMPNPDTVVAVAAFCALAVTAGMSYIFGPRIVAALRK